MAERDDMAVDEERGFAYRPGELLVAEPDGARLAPVLRGNAEREADGPAVAGVVRYRLTTSESVPEVVTRLRGDVSARLGGPPVRVAPNHVFRGEPFYKGGPGSTARPADEALSGAAAAGEGCTVGVLDTGLHPHGWLAGRVVSDDAEELDADGDDRLDEQAGHGTFVAGLVLTQAPGARVVLRRVLDSHGHGDELTIAAGIAALRDCDVLNLSLGGYTFGDQPPLALTAALEALPEGVAVVAAAGNAGLDRRFWPAASSRVVAVGALDRAGQARAGFSNHGDWVDACAPGEELLSTFVEWQGEGGGFRGWARWSGTSFAAPLVAGAIAAACMRDRCPPAQAAGALVQSAMASVPGLGAVVPLPSPPQ